MEQKRMRARITEEDLRFSPEVQPTEERETWQAVIDAAWDMTIASVACNDMRGPLARVPGSLEALERAVAGVKESATLAAVEEEIKAGIRVFSEMTEGLEESKARMERVLRTAWNRRTDLKMKGEV
jgi:hypothetical protein